MKVRLYPILCFFFLFLGCSQRPITSSLKPEKFQSQSSQFFLALDLSNDRLPKMGLVVSDQLEPGFKKTLIPFYVDHAIPNNILYSTYGQHQDITLFTFHAKANMSSFSIIPFEYIIKRQELTSPYTRSQKDDLIDSILTINEYGVLGRQVIYSYKKEREINQRIDTQIQSTLNLEIDSIAISIPEGSIRTEVVSGRTEDPIFIERIDNFTRFYPTAKNVNNDFLEIQYQIPEPDTVKLVGNILLVIFAPMLLGFVGFAFMSNEDIRRPLARKIALWIFGILEVFLVIGLIIYYQVVSIENRQNVIFTIVPILCGAATTVVVFIIKKPTNEQQQSINKVAQKIQALLEETLSQDSSLNIDNFSDKSRIAMKIVEKVENQDDLKELFVNTLIAANRNAIEKKIEHQLGEFIIVSLYEWKDTM